MQYRYALVFNHRSVDCHWSEKFNTLEEALNAFTHYFSGCPKGESLSIVDVEGVIHKKHYKN